MTATRRGLANRGLRSAHSVAASMSAVFSKDSTIEKQIRMDYLRRLVDRSEPALRRVFLTIIQQLKTQHSVDAIAGFIEQGNIQAALEASARAGARFAAAVNGVYIFAGEQTGEFIRDRLEVIIDFDQVNQRAVRHMQNNQLRLIREFTVEQTNTTREALTQGMRRGLNPREQARMFRDSLGLTTRQMQAVENYRSALERNSVTALTRQLRDRRFDNTVRRAARDQIPLTQSQIDKMVGRYSERFLRHRSEVIARTEALRSAHEGTREMYQQSFEQGIVKPEDVTQRWVTAGDERVRGSHDVMDGQERKPDEPFESGNGNLLFFPGDPSAPAEEIIQCRCVLTTRLK